MLLENLSRCVNPCYAGAWRALANQRLWRAGSNGATLPAGPIRGLTNVGVDPCRIDRSAPGPLPGLPPWTTISCRRRAGSSKARSARFQATQLVIVSDIERAAMRGALEEAASWAKVKRAGFAAGGLRSAASAGASRPDPRGVVACAGEHLRGPGWLRRADAAPAARRSRGQAATQARAHGRGHGRADGGWALGRSAPDREHRAGAQVAAPPRLAYHGAKRGRHGPGADSAIRVSAGSTIRASSGRAAGRTSPPASS